MSQNSIQKSAAQTIGEMPDMVTSEMAEEAMMLAEMEQTDLVKKVEARTVIGRYLTQSKGSHIVADIEVTRGQLERVMKQIASDIIEGKGTVASRAQSADTYAKLANARATQNMLSLKTQEIVAVSGKKEGQKGRAPGQIVGMQVNAENVQLVQAPPEKNAA